MQAEDAAARHLRTGTHEGWTGDGAEPAPLRHVAAFSTHDLPGPLQFDAWREQCRDIVEMLEDCAMARGYGASHRVWRLGGMALSQVHAPAAAFRRTATQIRRDSLDHWVVGLARRGRQGFRTETRTTLAEPGIPFIFSLHEPFEGRRDDGEWLALFIARDMFPDLAPRIDAGGPRVLDTPLGAILGGVIDTLATQLPHMPERDLSRAVEALRAVLRACLPKDGEAGEGGGEMLEQARLARIKGLIRANLRSPTLGPRRLCALGGISRSQLYRLFEPLGGVARHIQAERLRAAHRALSDPEERRDILRVAEQFGFYDASAFSRAFRREFGATPSEIRRAAEAGLRGAPVGRANPAELRFTDVLRGL